MSSGEARVQGDCMLELGDGDASIRRREHGRPRYAGDPAQIRVVRRHVGGWPRRDDSAFARAERDVERGRHTLGNTGL